MRSPKLLIWSFIILLILTSCFPDSSWMGIVGRWQDTEAEAMELEFTQGGTFNEYFFGQRVGYGEFEAQGNIINLHYLSPCGGPDQLSCDVRLGFTVTDETLIITDAQGDLLFRRVNR